MRQSGEWGDEKVQHGPWVWSLMPGQGGPRVTAECSLRPMLIFRSPMETKPSRSLTRCRNPAKHLSTGEQSPEAITPRGKLCPLHPQHGIQKDLLKEPKQSAAGLPEAHLQNTAPQKQALLASGVSSTAHWPYPMPNGTPEVPAERFTHPHLSRGEASPHTQTRDCPWGKLCAPSAWELPQQTT